ncbi:hypothetical protein AVEN_165177-1 [Araneus ventricosus]|uniref:Uncharacterized protein n=1 Tax=Araneus ventricosus TaxID=182803 RepID=A0A4Y2B5U0_ARAVE|nr:hypothetical protein AVEN_165177-1 [Araneus ventricosus]
MVGKRDLQSFLMDTKPMPLDHGDKMNVLQNARIMALSLLGTEIWRFFWRRQVLSDSYIYTRYSNKSVSLFGVLFAVPADKLMDTVRYR